jgi:hypothetical protein
VALDVLPFTYETRSTGTDKDNRKYLEVKVYRLEEV